MSAVDSLLPEADFLDIVLCPFQLPLDLVKGFDHFAHFSFVFADGGLYLLHFVVEKSGLFNGGLPILALP